MKQSLGGSLAGLLQARRLAEEVLAAARARGDLQERR